MKKTFIFDFDGTIAATIPNNKELAKLINTFGPIIGKDISVTSQDVERFRENSLVDLVKQFKIPLWKLPFIAVRIQKELKEYLEKRMPVSAMPMVLYKMKKKGHSLGIVSSANKKFILSFLKRYNLEIFDFVYTSNSLFGKHKVIHTVLEKHVSKNQEVIYVGDEIRDIQASKKSGIPIIAVTWGFNNKKGLKKHNPEYIIDVPQELLEVKFIE